MVGAGDFGQRGSASASRCSALSASDPIDQPNRVMDGLDRLFNPSANLLLYNYCISNY